MDRAQIRIELLRIAYARHGDDARALDIAKGWETWVIEHETPAETPAETPEPKGKARPNPARS